MSACHLKDVQTAALLTPSELIESLRLAGQQTYQARQGIHSRG
jgi:hypothetical protein